MQLNLTDTGRIETKGHKSFYRVETPRGYRLADFTTAAEASQFEISQRGKYGHDCRIVRFHL